MTSLQQTAMLGGEASAKTASYTLVAADAGTAISMSNASATTITVNTALFAAGDTVQITNLGAGVCTITAGTATVNTSASLALAQYESGTLDFTSPSAAIFIKGAAAASGGMTLIQRTSFSNVAGTSTTFDGVFSSTYVSYIIAIENLSAATGTDDLQIVFRYSGADGTAHYGNVMSNRYNASTWANTTSNGGGQITMYTFDAQSTYPLTGNLFISNVGASVKAAMTGHLLSATEIYYGLTYGYNDANGLTGFRLKSASTNITGTVAVYGLAK
jgi:hypothetical protein